MPVEANAYLEAKRYISNARKILSSSAGKSGEFYQDPKYVKMAANTAYCGVLVALTAALNIKPVGKGRVSVETFQKKLSTENKTVLNYFNTAYSLLHLSCGYDGNLHYQTNQNGLEIAEKIVEWSKSRIVK